MLMNSVSTPYAMYGVFSTSQALPAVTLAHLQPSAEGRALKDVHSHADIVQAHGTIKVKTTACSVL